MRVLSEYEIAWRKSVGHPVPTDGVLHDDDELEAMTAPTLVPQVAPVAPAPAVQPAPAPAPSAKPQQPPAGKK